LAIRPFDIDLDESAGELLQLPWSGRLARLEPHRDILDPHRLSRLQGQVANDAVPLIEQAKHGDAIGHPRDPGLLGERARHFQRHRLVARFIGLVAAGEQGQRHEQKRGARTLHSYSGFHAS
jgi:hypothetical protein